VWASSAAQSGPGRPNAAPRCRLYAVRPWLHCDSDSSPQRGHKVTQTWHQSEEAKPFPPNCLCIRKSTGWLPTTAIFEAILRKSNSDCFLRTCLVTSTSALIDPILRRISVLCRPEPSYALTLQRLSHPLCCACASPPHVSCYHFRLGSILALTTMGRKVRIHGD
jgi:hypothetical protein